jgi:peptide deformylase
MARLEVRLLGDPVLRTEAAPVGSVDAELRSLAADMFETMYAEEGVGLAAPQVGILKRLIVIDPQSEDVTPFALVNPTIVELADETERGEEGCLSVPGLKELVERPVRVVVEALDLEGQPIRIEAEGLLGRIMQHEVDHLDGILFLDRVSPLKRKMLLRKWEKVRPAQARS